MHWFVVVVLPILEDLCNWVPAKCFDSGVNLAMKQIEEDSFKDGLNKIKYF